MQKNDDGSFDVGIWGFLCMSLTTSVQIPVGLGHGAYNVVTGEGGFFGGYIVFPGRFVAKAAWEAKREAESQ